MCYTQLLRCPSCNSSTRYPYPCEAGTIISNSFKYTTLTAEVCAATGSLLAVTFATKVCNECIRNATIEEATKAKLDLWQQDLDHLTNRTVVHGRTSTLRASLKRQRRPATQDQGGRRALLRLWYAEAKARSLKTMVPASSPISQRSPRSPLSPRFLCLATPRLHSAGNGGNLAVQESEAVGSELVKDTSSPADL